MGDYVIASNDYWLTDRDLAVLRQRAEWYEAQAYIALGEAALEDAVNAELQILATEAK